MRSARAVFSLPISAPQMAMTLSALPAVAAATHGARSACGSAAGSAPVAPAACGDTAHSSKATAAFRISSVRPNRIDLLSELLSVLEKPSPGNRGAGPDDGDIEQPRRHSTSLAEWQIIFEPDSDSGDSPPMTTLI